MTPRLLITDARLRRDLIPEWFAERRAMYLLRDDLPIALSVDPKVWPRRGPCERVAIEVRAPSDSDEWRGYPEWTPPADLVLLGYDIADAVLTSGLSFVHGF